MLVAAGLVGAAVAMTLAQPSLINLLLAANLASPAILAVTNAQRTWRTIDALARAAPAQPLRAWYPRHRPDPANGPTPSFPPPQHPR